MKIHALHAIDFYKSGHIKQYRSGTTEIYSNFTPRGGMGGPKEVVFFGLQYFIRHFLVETFGAFFESDKKEVLDLYKRRMDLGLGVDSVGIEHMAKLHDLGYLPIRIKALPEGALVPLGVPVLTIVNTHPDFFWLPNYLESALSCYLWKAITSATTAYNYKKLFQRFSIETGSNPEALNFQGHDFSFRGMSSLQDAAISGAAHLTSFHGTDSVLALDLIDEFYTKEGECVYVGGSVPATEHSVMCVAGKSMELENMRRLITEVYPSGMVSIVCDTWDFWNVVTDYIPMLKDDIMKRDGKVIIRPDSGDPVKIICGDRTYGDHDPRSKGLIQCLWEIFGGHYNSKGYKELDCHVGAIYGDSITYDRALIILDQLTYKKFASSNIVFGIGSFTYQHVTRDTHGFAMKSTSAVVNGERIDIFKDPKTDSGVKKSARGLLYVEVSYKEEGTTYVLDDQVSDEFEKRGRLKTVFEDGHLYRLSTFNEIRERVEDNLNQEIKNDIF